MQVSREVKVLEARFHPQSKMKHSRVIVGRVICFGANATVQFSELARTAVAPFEPSGLRTKLQFLVETAYPHPYEVLTKLRSEYWEFTEVAVGSEPALS